MNRPKPHSFVKWCGGKSYMSDLILEKLPPKFNTYFEPFVGGGTVFFELSRQNRFKNAVIGDMNPELMNAYRIIKRDVNGLISELRSGRYIYDKDRYIEIRSEAVWHKTAVERAARFLYLNRTCFNGLYRVNQSGKFNVPFGKYKNPIICDAENLLEVSKCLKHVRLTEKSFEFVLDEAKSGDVVYFDPPYMPVSKTANFSSYTAEKFSLTDHTLLSLVFDQLVERGVTVIASNSIAARELYEGHEVVGLIGGRCIGGPTEYRNSVAEIMVVGRN